MIKLENGQWLDATGSVLESDLLDKLVQEVCHRLVGDNLILTDLLVRAFLVLEQAEQSLEFTETLPQLSAGQQDYLAEHLEDVLMDLAAVDEDLIGTVAEIQDLVAEKMELEEDYLDRMGDLDNASSDDLNALSGQLAVVLELEKEIEEMLLERVRLEEDKGHLLAQLGQLLTFS